MTDNNNNSGKSTAGSTGRARTAMWLGNTGMFIILVAIAMPLLRVGDAWWRYLFAAGAAATLVGRLFSAPPAGASLRVRRLCRMELWAAIMFCASVFCMFYPGMGPTDWIAFTLAGGVLHLYASIAVPRAIAREAAAKQEPKSDKKR